MIRVILLLVTASIISSCTLTYEKNFGGDSEPEEKDRHETGTFYR